MPPTMDYSPEPDEAPIASVGVLERRGVLLLSFPKHFTVREAIHFRQGLDQQLTIHQTIRQIVLDFSRTVLVDSSGLGALIINFKQARLKSIPLIAWSAGSQVRLAFALAGLDQVIPIVDSTQALNPDQPVQQRLEATAPHPSVRSRSKRLLDLMGSLIGLTFTMSLFPVIALAIQMDNPGPVLFSQTRIGYMGRRFRLWKFRSMVVDAEALRDQVCNEAKGALFKNHNDPRMTRVGRFLRRTSLDELPQFWNVLTGDMSLIGTRPPTVDEVERYAVPNWQRFDVKPGMSGEWQVFGRSEVNDFEDVIRLDLRYQKRWSIRHDFYLIARTILLVFSRKSGAF